jgi:hypothetical protein
MSIATPEKKVKTDAWSQAPNVGPWQDPPSNQQTALYYSPSPAAYPFAQHCKWLRH